MHFLIKARINAGKKLGEELLDKGTKTELKALDKAEDVSKNIKKVGNVAEESKTVDNNTERVQRWMSEAELKATQETGLVRGGREGIHHVTDSANSNAKRATQRTSLEKVPEIRVELEVPQGSFSPPTKVLPANNMPGGGTERMGTGNIPATVKKVWRNSNAK